VPVPPGLFSLGGEEIGVLKIGFRTSLLFRRGRLCHFSIFPRFVKFFISVVLSRNAWNSSTVQNSQPEFLGHLYKFYANPSLEIFCLIMKEKEHGGGKRNFGG
jgi:hypothetical protein